MPNVIEKAIAKVFGGKEVPDNSTDAIPTGATNLTIGSAFVAGLALVVDQFTGWSDKLLGANAGAGSRAALAIAIIGAAAVVFAADLLARGYASAHAAKPTEPAQSATTPPHADAAGVTVSIPGLPSEEEHGWRVIQAQEDRVLVVKKDRPARWYPITEVRGE